MEFAWLALFAVVIAAVVITLVRHARRQDARVQVVWKAFAREHGLRWKDTEGFWISERYEVHGESSGVPVRLQKHVVHTGKSTIVFTRFVGRMHRSVERKISVRRRSFATRLGETFGYKPISTGDAAFDIRMALRSQSRDDALAIVGPVARERIASFPKRLRVDCKGDEAKVWWRGMETDPQVLASALAILTAVCGADEGSRSRAASR